jgi:hypothetical protein
MKSMFAVMACGAMCAASAVAQDHDVVFEKMVPQIRVMSLQGGVMGKPIKGAPYSAVEISESNQMLADGTRIHNESQTQVYRDSEGRMRRETPNEITIWDPVANASWVLNPKTQTARKLPMGTFSYTTIRDPNGAVLTNTVRGLQTFEAGSVHMEETRIVESKLGEAREKLAADKMKAEIETHLRANGGATAGRMVTGGGVFVESKSIAARKGNAEPLGRRMIEGVNSDGTRFVTTIEAGAIGNDRAIQSVNERWYSSELQTVMLTRTTDPRTGEETFKLANVSRAEPAAYLFQVPAGYQVVDAK